MSWYETHRLEKELQRPSRSSTAASGNAVTRGNSSESPAAKQRTDRVAALRQVLPSTPPARPRKPGIVYTPSEIVDFILQLGQRDVCRSISATTLGARRRSTSWTPFTGTGTSSTRICCKSGRSSLSLLLDCRYQLSAVRMPALMDRWHSGSQPPHPHAARPPPPRAGPPTHSRHGRLDCHSSSLQRASVAHLPGWPKQSRAQCALPRTAKDTR